MSTLSKKVRQRFTVTGKLINILRNTVSEATEEFNQPLNPSVNLCQPTLCQPALCSASVTKLVFKVAIQKLPLPRPAHKDAVGVKSTTPGAPSNGQK